MKKNAFTLIELLVVVLVIGILAAIALPMYTKIVNRYKMQEGITNVKAIMAAEHRYYQNGGTYTNDLEALDITLNTDKWQYRISTNIGGILNDQSYQLEAHYGTKISDYPFIRVYYTTDIVYEKLGGRKAQYRRLVCIAANGTTASRVKGQKLCESVGRRDAALDAGATWGYQID